MGQIFPVPSHTGELWIVGSHVPFGLCRSSTGGHRPERCIFAEQGATVEDVECSSQPPYRHNHPGTKMCCALPDPLLLLYRVKRFCDGTILVAAVRPKTNPKSCKFILSPLQSNEVNQGDALEHNFSAIHAALMFPLTHLRGAGLPQVCLLYCVFLIAF